MLLNGRILGVAQRIILVSVTFQDVYSRIHQKSISGCDTHLKAQDEPVTLT